jgi:hypothetical protein
MDST